MPNFRDDLSALIENTRDAPATAQAASRFADALQKASDAQDSGRDARQELAEALVIGVANTLSSMSRLEMELRDVRRGLGEFGM
jgi:hypothetical protein